MSIDACYFPIKGLDDVLANKIGNMTSGEVAGYRTLLEDRKGDKVTLDDYEELVSFIANINEEDKKEARRRTKLTRASREAIIHKHLLKTFSPELLISRINMIATLFSSVVDSYASENPQYSREQIIRMVGFSNLILDVRDEVEELLVAAENLKDEYKISEFNKVLNNWDALVYRAQPYMKTYEDVKLGQDFDFVVSANEGNYNENDLSWTFTAEESTREHWQTQQDFVSAFGSLGKEVRKALSRIHMVAQGGSLERDDLGVAVNLSPNKVHQTLLDVFRGVTSSTQMMEVLNAYQSRNPWARGLYAKLASDPILRTQFFVDLYKNFQVYSMQFTDKKGNLRTKILNRQATDSAYSKYKSDVLIGKHFTKSIFSMNGEYATLNRVNIEAVNNKIQMLFSISQKDWDEYNKAVEKWNNRTNVFERKPKRPSLKFYDKNLAEQEVELQDIFNRLNISIDQDQLSRLMANNKDFKALLEHLLNLSRYSLSKISDYDILAEDFIKDNIYFKENITKIVGLISKYNNGLTMDARARFHGNTYQSNVTPSYMGDFFGFIENCVKNDDNKALLEFLQNKFLKSHTFMYNDVILNTWIKELIEGGTEEGSFASNFIWKKGLAIDDIDFEDFSANNHIKYLMTEYFSEREIKGNPDIVYVSEEDYNALTNKDPKKVYYIEHSNFAYKYNQRKTGNDKWERIEKDDYAYYPTFILGDANVAKFIKARRYSLNEIVDGFYNTYVSELRRQKNTEELEAYWKSKGISPNKNLIKNKDKFIMLPFLNKDYKGGKYYTIANKGKWYRLAIKAAIREYLEDSAKEFESKLISKKIIGENNSERVHDYFYNTSFATIQQLQMMTIDVAFYDSIKDLQKRYKEIHAPGSILDVNALDPWNENKPVSDGIERVIYFKEVRTDAEETNPEFMRAIEKHFGKGSRIANLYKKNKSTDGQGYRTLESYRKVMIMAGKWNNEFENAYNLLNTLRERARLEGRKTFTEEEMRVLDDVMVSFQPIKPYFYGFENIEGSNQLIPVQHKYAEAVLIPEFLPKDSSLRELAEFMEDNGIDIAGSTEIVKVGEYGSIDISKGNIYQTLEEGATTGSLVIHQLPYSSYRIQTNVPNHTHQSRLFGTQFRKLIMSNLHKSGNTAYSSYLNSDGILVKNDNGKVVIVDGEGPVNLNKNGLTRFYNALIIGNIIESFNLFKQRAGDKYKLSSSAIYQIINNDREIKDNILAMSIDEFEDFVVPLFEGGIEHDAAAMLFSIYKKLVNKQSILGGSAVQVSDFGITGKEESKHLKFVTDPNNPNNILYAECEIPFNFSYTDANGRQVDLKFSDYCNSDGTFIEGSKKGTTKIEEEFPGILDIIAYRIPTERAYSMMNLKVVRCSHPLAGGTIKVPSQGVTIAGFDFDVDKLYFMRNEFKQKYKTTDSALSEKDKYDIWTQVYEEHRDIEAALQAAKDLYGGDNALNSYWELSTISTLYDKDELFEEAADILGIDISVKKQDTYWDFYDTSKSPFQQSTTARNNMILHLSKMRLQDEETFSERYTPGGFPNASRAARLMRELEFSNHDSFIMGDRVNLDGLKNDIDFDDKDSDPEPNYDPSNPMTIVTYNQQNQVAGKLIGIFANQNTHHAFISSLLECYLEIPIAFNGHPSGLKDLLHAPEGVDTSLTMAEFLAASVDAVKDPVLNFLNLNTLTADSGALLARLGYSLESIGLLFNQPIIKRLCEYSFDNNIKDIDELVKVVASEYGSQDITKVTVRTSEVTDEKLAYSIIAGSARGSNKGMKVDKNQQLQVLRLFLDINKNASELSQFILNTKFTAANSVSSTFGAAYEKQMKLNAYVAKLENENKPDKEESSNLIHIKVNIENDVAITNKMPKFGSKEYLERLLRNPLAYEQAMLDANTEALKIFDTLVPYETEEYSQVRSILASFTKSGSIDAETIDSVHRELPVYMLQNDELSYMNPLRAMEGDTKTIKEYYMEEFPKKLASIVRSNPLLRNMELFKFLSFPMEDGKFYISPEDTGGIGPEQVDIIRSEMSSLYRNPETKNIVEGLFYYSFFTVGFNFNHNSLVNLFPTEFKTTFPVARDREGNNISYSEYLRQVKDNGRSKLINSSDFAIKYVLNHTDNTRLVYAPRGKMLEKIVAIINNAKENGSEDSFTISRSNLGNRFNAFVLNPMDNTYRPFLNINGTIYEAKGDKGFNVGTTSSMTYVKAKVLGDGVNALNYSNGTKPSEIGRQVEGRKPEGLPEPGEAPKYDEAKVNELFVKALDTILEGVKRRGLEANNFANEAEANATISNLKDMYLSKEYSIDDKIDTIKKSAPELMSQLLDAEEKPICG